MKLIFVTGGVISGLGKGITAASIGRLIKSAGYSITMTKMDPYLNIDAGTMSPYEHGETFVTDDGFETDLDLGHYERFIDENLTKSSSITTGQVYQAVINKERKGEYLGKNVQVIPHITNEIEQRITQIAKDKDVTIIEIGGTVGDIEGPHFIETMRQLRHKLGKQNVLFVHVVPIITVTTSGEMKTKAIQHSVVKLREMGIHANILVCRTTKHIDEDIKNKLALFCDVDKEHIIEAMDQNIYQVPLSFKEQHLDTIIIERFFGNKNSSIMTEWQNHVNNLLNPKQEISIAIAGKYTHLQDCYISVLEAIKHAGALYQTKINIERIETENLEDQNREENLHKIINNKKIKGIIVPGGFGSRGIEGMINVANFCRSKNLPYLGLCLGLQIAIISFARHVCKIDNANSTEFDENTIEPIIKIMNNQKEIQNKGGTMRLGTYPAILKENTQTYDLYKKYGIRIQEHIIEERHRHRYEVNPDYHQVLEDAGIVISGKSPDGKLVEFIELKNHKYYIATQSHPELKSRLTKPHPLFVGFIKSCIQ